MGKWRNRGSHENLVKLGGLYEQLRQEQLLEQAEADPEA
jgi:hypothetical protein